MTQKKKINPVEISSRRRSHRARTAVDFENYAKATAHFEPLTIRLIYNSNHNNTLTLVIGRYDNTSILIIIRHTDFVRLKIEPLKMNRVSMSVGPKLTAR